MRAPRKYLLIMLSSATLVACGGGGSGDDSAPVASAPATVTSNNAETIAAVASEAATESSEFGGSTGPGLFLQSTAAKAQGSGAAGVVMKLIRLNGQSGQFLQPQETTVLPPEPCLVSGDVSFTVTLADPNTLSPGDGVSANFNNCDDGAGTVLNGTFDFTFVNFSQSILDCMLNSICSNQDQLTVRLILTDFRVTEGGESSTFNGDTTLVLDTLNFPQSSLTLSGDLQVQSSGGATMSLSSFSTTLTDDGSGLLTLTANGTVESPAHFSGSVSYNTTVPFQSIGSNYPYAGELVVTGAEGATITLTALDDVNVQWVFDPDGNGPLPADPAVPSTWAALDALL